MPKTTQFTLKYDQDLDEYLNREFPKMIDYRILSQSLDARSSNKGRVPTFQYRVEIIENGETFTVYKESFAQKKPFIKKPIIIGTGPAGLFCALRFAEYGIPCTLIERGKRAHERMKDIAQFWRYGKFNTESNVCFGEGGAGLFSDGKLITRVKSPYVQYVMNRLVDFGAPEETAYLSNPHLGSNKIRILIGKISKYLVENKFDIKYETKLEKIIFEKNKVCGVELSNGQKIETDHVILATGHSAGDIYQHLVDENVFMKQKDFAVGVRVEHPRELINKIQYGNFSTDGRLGTARYRLSYENREQKRGTYSFCMCPGGYVLSSGTEADGIVVNGMSNYSRRSPWSNAALVVSVKAGIDFPEEDVLSGLKFQREIEQKAFLISKDKASGKELPSQTLYEFLDDKLNHHFSVLSSAPSKLVHARLSQVLPSFITDHLKNALMHFDRNMPGFISKDGLFIAPETRTSAPVSILRNRETLESESHKGLYPCGEGAGHAGGITSAAVDGVKVAESIIMKNL